MHRSETKGQTNEFLVMRTSDEFQHNSKKKHRPHKRAEETEELKENGKEWIFCDDNK